MALQEAPPFWWQKFSWQAFALSPISLVYGKIAAGRMASTPVATLDVPVICVGNLVAGGAGKTPTVIAFAGQAKAMGLRPGILSRGHGGGISTATVVNLKKHDSRDVGDEPLLLAKVAMTVVSVNRPSGANLLVEQGCDLIIMDDGFQNPSLRKDFSVVVVDALRGVGNGFSHPAGPLRAPVSRQMPFASAVLVIGEGSRADGVIRRAAKNAKPIQLAKMDVRGKRGFKGKRVLAFAGIGNPEKFFASLNEVGAEIVERRVFGDHHHYHDDEIRDLLSSAKKQELQLVSTAKDMIRLRGLGELPQELAANTDVVHIQLKFEDPDFVKRAIESAIAHAQLRKG